MNALNGKWKLQSPSKPSARPNCDYRRKLIGLKRVIKDLVLENAYLCDEVAQVHEDTVVLKEETRSLLKRLNQLEASAGIESTLQPTGYGVTDNQTSSPATKKAPKRKAVQDEEVNGNASSHTHKQKITGRSKAIKEEHFEVDVAD